MIPASKTAALAAVLPLGPQSRHWGRRPSGRAAPRCPAPRDGVLRETVSSPARRRPPPPAASGPSAEPAESGASMFDLETLQKALQFAVREENYTAAAELRDQIRRAERADPLLSLAARLREAVAEERFGDAALLRDQLKELAPPPPDPPSTSSSKVTEGVRVSVQSCFVPSQSRPAASAFLYAYRIRIENVSHPCTVKLVSRHWIITDAQGGVQEVRGPGVVGEEPELAPGCSFEYQSACPLRSASGSMKGSFEFYSRAGETGAWSTSFLVEVAEFGLSAEGPTSL